MGLCASAEATKPAVEAAFELPVARETHRCPHCRTPVFVGKLGPGTVIEIQCRRKHCRGYVRPFHIVVM